MKLLTSELHIRSTEELQAKVHFCLHMFTLDQGCEDLLETAQLEWHTKQHHLKVILLETAMVVGDMTLLLPEAAFLGTNPPEERTKFKAKNLGGDEGFNDLRPARTQRKSLRLVW